MKAESRYKDSYWLGRVKQEEPMCLWQTVHRRETSCITAEDRGKVQELEIPASSEAEVRYKVKSRKFAWKYCRYTLAPYRPTTNFAKHATHFGMQCQTTTDLGLLGLIYWVYWKDMGNLTESEINSYPIRLHKRWEAGSLKATGSPAFSSENSALTF